MKSIGDLLRHIPVSPVAKGIAAARIVETANQALINFCGAEIETVAQAVFVRNDTLYIACLNSVAAQEIKLHEVEIADFIKNKIGFATIKKICYES